MKAITPGMTTKFDKQFQANNKQQALQRVVVKNGIIASAENISAHVANTPVFSIDLAAGKVANQMQSGRCWMFAALDTFRHKTLSQFYLKEFELSQNYIFFWDKYEKANYFYENIIATGKEAVDSRKVTFLLTTPQQDDGQWDMIVSLFQKHGVVPESVMPEGANSSNFRDLNNYLNKLLRRDAIVLREMVTQGETLDAIKEKKEEMLESVYNFLTISLGTPPEEFGFKYRDEEQNYHLDRGLAPQIFYDKYIGVKLDDYINVINALTKDKPFNRSYTVEMLGSVVDEKEAKYLNVDMETFKKLAIAQLEQGEFVWFGCDVGQSSTRTSGIMTLDAYSMDGLFDTDSTMAKAGRLNFGESLMTHAMVLTGVDLVDGQSTKRKVENSWGEKVGKNGFFVMSDAWMDEYTYQIVVRKDLLTKEQLNALNEEPIMLAPWDPMDALA